MLRLWVLSNPNILFTNEGITVSDSETSPEVNTGDVEGNVNVGTEAPAEESAPEGGDSEGGDDNASATDDASVDTGALQE